MSDNDRFSLLLLCFALALYLGVILDLRETKGWDR